MRYLIWLLNIVKIYKSEEDSVFVYKNSVYLAKTEKENLFFFNIRLQNSANLN